MEIMDTSAEDLKHYSLAISALKKAVSDTEKFGALFVVSNVLKDKPLNCEQNLHLFQSIEPKFLCRLLLSDGQTIDVPEGCPQYIYQSIGISIISSFFIRIADSIDSKTSVQLLSSMAIILRQLTDKDQDLDETEKQMISDIIVCFEFFFSSKSIRETSYESIKRLFDSKFTQILVKIYLNERFSEYKTSVKQLLLKIAMTVELSDFDPKSFDTSMTWTEEEFRTTQDKHKFELCQPLDAIIIRNQKYFLSHSDHQSIHSISDTILNILRNKLNKDLRDPVIKLCATLTDVFNGFKWIYWSEEWDENNCKHFLLLLRLSCIEIALNLESEEVDMSSVANCFVILEHSVITVANDSEDLLLLRHLTQEEIFDMLTAIRDTMSVIIRYLQRFKDQDMEMDDKSDVFVSILAAIRVLCVWVTEETEFLREEIADILPFILRLFRKTYENRLSINKSIISALISLAENDVLKNILLNENLIQFLESINDRNNSVLINDLKELLQK